MGNIGLYTYLVAAVAFALLAVLIMVQQRRTAVGPALLAGCSATALWAGTVALGTLAEYPPLAAIQLTEAARNLAQRIIKEGGENEEARIEWAWRTVASRRPEPSETQVVVELLRLHEARFSNDPSSAQKLIAFGESSPDKTILPRELASWTLVANLLLNLDEVVNKN